MIRRGRPPARVAVPWSADFHLPARALSFREWQRGAYVGADQNRHVPSRDALGGDRGTPEGAPTAQATVKMANRTTYQDHGLVFAKEAVDVQTPRAALGQTCHALVKRHLQQVIRAAGVRPIKVHGLRHTCATLLLQTNTPIQVVAQRLGHKQITMTLEVYAHALPDMQRDAADRLGALLAGR